MLHNWGNLKALEKKNGPNDTLAYLRQLDLRMSSRTFPSAALRVTRRVWLGCERRVLAGSDCVPPNAKCLRPADEFDPAYPQFGLLHHPGSLR